MSEPGQAGSFPTTRLRRLRRHEWLRRAVAETVLTPADLVWPDGSWCITNALQASRPSPGPAFTTRVNAELLQIITSM